jgi:UDP-N-acetylmuramoyl-L-alanyl-D-glutamate--2,6-diaminopimelate ligase
VLEVTAGGIGQKRVHGVQLAAAVFTNHADGNEAGAGSPEADFGVKLRLFSGEAGPLPKAAVVNLDDSFGAALLAALPPEVRRVTFGENAFAQVRAANVAFTSRNTTFTLVWPGGEMSIDSPLIGRANLSNLLAAVATAWSLGRDPVVFLAKLRAFKGVPGRMERVDAGQSFNVFVDYARTSDAIRQSLGALRTLTSGRLVVVFGSGENLNRAARSQLVQTVQSSAEFSVATANNPGSEPLADSFAQMSAGVSDSKRIEWIADRRRAIARGIEICGPGDTLLITGKGHESYQKLADTVVPFDDREVVRELIVSATEKS